MCGSLLLHCVERYKTEPGTGISKAVTALTSDSYIVPFLFVKYCK